MSNNNNNNQNESTGQRKKQKISKTVAEESAFLVYYDKEGISHKTKLTEIVEILKKSPIEQQNQFNNIGLVLTQDNEYNAVIFKRYMEENSIESLKSIFLQTDLKTKKDIRTARTKFIEFLHAYFKDIKKDAVLSELLEMKNGPSLLSAMIDNGFFSFDTYTDGFTDFYKKIGKETRLFEKGTLGNFQLIKKIFDAPIYHFRPVNQLHIIDALFTDFIIPSPSDNSEEGDKCFFSELEANASKTFEFLKQMEILGDGNICRVLKKYVIGFDHGVCGYHQRFYDSDAYHIKTLFLKLLITYFHYLVYIYIYEKNDIFYAPQTEKLAKFYKKMIITLITKFPGFVVYGLKQYYDDQTYTDNTFALRYIPFTFQMSPDFLKILKINNLDITLCKKTYDDNGKLIKGYVLPPTINAVINEIEAFENISKKKQNENINNNNNNSNSNATVVVVVDSNNSSISKAMKRHLNYEFSWSIKRLLFLQRTKGNQKRRFATLPLDIFKYIFELVNVNFLNQVLLK